MFTRSLVFISLLAFGLTGCDSRKETSRDVNEINRNIRQMNEMGPMLNSYLSTDLSQTTVAERAAIKTDTSYYISLADEIFELANNPNVLLPSSSEIRERRQVAIDLLDRIDYYEVTIAEIEDLRQQMAEIEADKERAEALAAMFEALSANAEDLESEAVVIEDIESDEDVIESPDLD
jgi:hypothetical protein